MTEHRVLITAENVSARFGGEAFLPLHYFRVLRGRRMEAFLLTHERVRPELEELFPDDQDRIEYVPETSLNVSLWKMGTVLPKRVDEVSFGAARTAMLQREMRKRARRIVKEQNITVVHEPIPVSPKMPSGMYDVGAPVVIGPMNGNMKFPPAFASFDGLVGNSAKAAGKASAELLNKMVPGKLKAEVLLVSNPRTREGLPESAAHVPVVEIVENGVDMRRFKHVEIKKENDGTTRFAFVGRLVGWKAVNLLLEAIAKIPAETKIALDLMGDGEERPALEELAKSLGIDDRVTFHGFLPQAEVAERLEQMDALVLPSLYECGGAVVLEAMAKSLPAIATNWGGPADYLDDNCGILIDTADGETIINGFRDAMIKLAESPELRTQLGHAGRKKIEEQYDWERKVDRILEVYDQARGRKNAKAS